MLFLARSMPYRASHVPSIVELLTRLEAAYPSVTAAVRYCHEPLLDGNVCRTTQYVTVKERAFADCVSVYTTSKTRHCYYKAHCRNRAWGFEPHDATHHRALRERSRTANKSYCL